MKYVLFALFVALAVGIEVIADIFLKKSGLSNYRYILIGIVLYAAIGIPVAVAFNYSDFGALFIAWEAIGVIFGLVVATLYFKEPFTIYRFTAVILALGALVLSYK
jgi:multidrug transporter EmrE-like cation transporter